ncbi:MAG: sulfatase-like hydrolase/transferase [Polyangiaceae bacterium]
MKLKDKARAALGRVFKAMSGRTLLLALASAALAGGATGTVDGWLAATRRTFPLPVHTGAAIVGAAGVLVALVSYPFLVTLYVAGQAIAERFQLGQHVSRAADADRSKVVRLHANVVAAFVVLGVLGLGMRRVVVVLRAIQEEGLKEWLLVGAAIGLGLAALATQLGVAAIGRWLFGKIDARVRLPLPPWPRAQRIVYFALPLALGSTALLLAVGSSLVALVRVGLLGLVFGAGWMVFELLTFLAARWPRVLRGVAAVVVVVVLGWTVQRSRKWERKPLRALEQRPVSGQAIGLMRLATDIDFDGDSSLFGGRDCKPFAHNIHPGAREIPGNKIDENCDGRDAGGVSAESAGPLFYGALSNDEVRSYNVVWFIVDAVRADHVSFLGYKKDTMPYVGALAEDSFVFERAYSQASATQLSIPSMLTGLDPGRLTWEEIGGRLQPAEHELLVAERFKKRGYETFIVGNPYFERIPGFLRGYDEVIHATRDQQAAPGQAAAMAVSFIERAVSHQNPFFLTVYVAAPHQPYVKHDEGFIDFGSGDKGKYDSELAAADRSIGFVLESLKYREDVWNNTIVVVLSDHGEEFGDHGGSGHAKTCYVESVHVPLVVRVPGMQGKHVDSRVALVDVVPTLIELANLPYSEDEKLDGNSLLLSARSPDQLDAKRPIFCNIIGLAGTNGVFRRRAVRTGDYSYLEELSGSGEAILYNGESDLKEKSPLPLEGENAEIAESMRQLLDGTMVGNLPNVNLEKLKN